MLQTIITIPFLSFRGKKPVYNVVQCNLAIFLQYIYTQNSLSLKDCYFLFEIIQNIHFVARFHPKNRRRLRTDKKQTKSKSAGVSASLIDALNSVRDAR